MDKFLAYIKNGKDRGLLFLAAAAALTVMIFIISFKNVYTDLKPSILTVAEEFLPIKAENGKIVNPVDAYKKIDVDLSGELKVGKLFPIVLDTQKQIDKTPDKMGLYITLNKVYFVLDNEEVLELPIADGELNHDNFGNILDNMVNSYSLFITIFTLAIIFLVYLIKALIVALLVLLVFALYKHGEVSFSLSMRLSAVLMSVLELSFFILRWFGIAYISGLWVIVIAVVIASVFVYQNVLNINNENTSV